MKISLMASAALAAFCVAQEAGPLQKSLQDMEVQGPWVYNNLATGFAEAKKTGKPLLVVFR